MADFIQKKLSKWKAPFQSGVAEVAANNPISSVLSLGAVPLVGSLLGKAGNVASAMLTPDDRTLGERVSDNVAPVAQRTADELSGYANGTEGKPTRSKPYQASITPTQVVKPAVVAPAAPAAQPAKPVLGASKFASRVKTPRTGMIAPAISQPDEEGLRTLPVGPQVSDAVDAGYGEYTGQQILGENRTQNYADGTGRVNLQYNPAVAAQLSKDALALQAAPPATFAPRTTTVGNSGGVYELAAGQSAPQDPNTMTLGQVAMAKFGLNQQVKQAGINNSTSNANTAALAQQQVGTHLGNTDALASILAPSQIAQNLGSANSSNANAKTTLAESPGKILHNLASAEFLRKHGISLEAATAQGWSKLEIEKEYKQARAAAQAKQTSSSADYPTMLNAAKEIINNPDSDPDHVLKARKTLAVIARGATKVHTSYNLPNPTEVD